MSTEGRARRFGHKGAVLWFTGLSGAGKSTLAMELEQRLLALGYACYTLDGDNLRCGLNADLGYSAVDRSENIRRAGEVASLFADAGLICIAAFISPYRSDRAKARMMAGHSDFFEVFLATDLATCEQRDPKGLYRKARAGILPEFTGVGAPYEVPEKADLVIDTSTEEVEQSVQCLTDFVRNRLPLL